LFLSSPHTWLGMARVSVTRGHD